MAIFKLVMRENDAQCPKMLIFYASEVTLCDKWTERDGVPQFSIWQRRPPGRQQLDQILTPTSPWGAERQTVSMQIAIAAVGVKYGVFLRQKASASTGSSLFCVSNQICES